MTPGSFPDDKVERQTQSVKESRFETLLKKNLGIKDFEDVKDPWVKMCLDFALTTIESPVKASDEFFLYHVD